jgi:extracellular elastinolytic metalloproteinase
MIENPEYLLSSPLGWHNYGTNSFNVTRGNNCDSMYSITQRRTTCIRPNVFEATFDSTSDPLSDENINAAIVNAFYGIFEVSQ